MNLTVREAIILKVVQDKSLGGTQIRKEYEKHTGIEMPLGSLYTTLKRMSNKNLVKSNLKGRFRVYDTTVHGNRLLNSFLSSWLQSTPLQEWNKRAE